MEADGEREGGRMEEFSCGARMHAFMHACMGCQRCLITPLRCCRFLTDKGIEYLREYLNLPSEIVPATLKKTTRPLERGPQRPERGPRREGGGFGREGGREGYRAGPREGGFGRGAPADKAGAPGSYQPQFGGGSGGFGRGAPAQ